MSKYTASPQLWIDLPGLTLSPEDKEILLHPFITGVILFSKNFESVTQLKQLTRAIHSVSPQLMITVDQEGGRVQRFREGFTALPAMREWCALYQKNPLKTKQDFQKTIHIMMQELREVGIHYSLVPVLDLDYGRSEIIGERSFGSDPGIVIELAGFMIDYLHTLGAPVVAKHFPGHGWVRADSHLALPVDERDFATIAANDLLPFKQLAQKCNAMMTAHIVYERCDANPVCFSRFWLQNVLRDQLQFQGKIISDDLTMAGAAVVDSYLDRAMMASEAGCDILIVCNARDGVIEILDNIKVRYN